MNRRLAVLLLATLALFLLVSSASAAIVDRGVKRTAIGLTERGYLLSPDDAATYEFPFPHGMTMRARIEVDPASSLRVRARLDAWPTVLTDDSCDDAVIEFEALHLDGSTIPLTIMPCPGKLDIDVPFFVTLDYDPMLQEVEPNETYFTAMWLDGSLYESRIFLDYEGAIAPAGDYDRYMFDARDGQVFRATMTPRNSNVQPQLGLFGPNNYVLDSTSCGPNVGACLDVVLPHYGTYQVYARSTGDQVGGYALSFDFGDNMVGEPNDSPEDGVGISAHSHIAAIDPVGDVDYYSIFSEPGRILRIGLRFPTGVGLAHAAVAVLDENLDVVVEGVLSADNPSFDVAFGMDERDYYLRISDADNGTGDPDAIHYWPRLEWIGPYVSSNVNGLGGYNRSDLLVREEGYWQVAFDASYVGITQDIAAAEFLPNGTLLMALAGPQTVPGLGKVTPWDIIRFVPNPDGLGDYTGGVFEWYVDGSDVGLAASGERIDAIALSSTNPDDFDLVISLTGSGIVPKTGGGTIAVRDEDQIRLENAVYGEVSSGTWAMHLDGSTVRGLAAEDIRGATLAQAPSGYATRGAALLLLENAFVIDGVKGDPRDILLAWQGLGPTDLDVVGLALDDLGDKKLDAITIGPVLSD